MKTLLGFLAISVLFASASCSKDNNNSNNPDALEGKWFIHYYWDDKDETSDFANYIFEFLPNNVVTATKATITVTGTWQETSTKFTLNFGTDPLLQEINDDWQKIEKTSDFLRLEDDNPDQDDELHFKKLQ